MPLIDNFEFNFPGRMMNQQVCNKDSLKSVLLTLFGHTNILYWKSADILYWKSADFLSYHTAHIEGNQGL